MAIVAPPPGNVKPEVGDWGVSSSNSGSNNPPVTTGPASASATTTTTTTASITTSTTGPEPVDTTIKYPSYPPAAPVTPVATTSASRSALAAESTGPMTDIMSYQYPPPPPTNGADMDMPPSGYISNYSTSSPMEVRPSHAQVLSLKERKTLSKVMKLKRSISTPSVRPPSQQPPPLPTTPSSAQTQQQASALPPGAGVDPSGMGMSGERRRNKLGYHRTSVACGHCRRRKIRCIPSPSDVQGRCINCIRLKKECSFYPVDQQPPTATVSKAVPRTANGSKIASASSSPAIPPGHPSDPYQNMSMPPIQNMAPPMKPPGSDAYPDTKYASPSSSKPGEINTQWRGYPQESPMTPSFSPYTPHAPPSSATWGTPVASEPPHREDMGWSYPPPPRSMSFGGETAQYPARGYERKASSMSSDMYPPPIATTMTTMETIPGTTLEQHVSLSAGAVAPSYQPWQQPSYSYAKPGDPYGGWYENGANAPLGPEEVPPPGNENPVPGTANMYQYATGR